MRKAWRAQQRGAAPTHKIKRSHCYFFFAVVIRKVVRIDSRLHCTEYRHPLKLGGQQWRRREKRKLSRRLRRRRPLGRRSSLRRLRSLISLESKIGSHGPADVGRVVMIALGWPAPVNSRGRRRDGGISFTIATTPRDSVDEIRQVPISLRCSTGRLSPSTISPTPSDILSRLSLALWSNSVAPFLLDRGSSPNAARPA